MLFVSHNFLEIFLPATLLLFFGQFFWSRAGVYVLLLASFVFCASNGVWQTALLGASILFNFLVGGGIGAAFERPRSIRRLILLFGVVGNLGVLGYFKYAGFIISNINEIFNINLSDPKVTLPIGISFYTFTQIAYLADSYKGKAPTRPSLPIYALFVTYFPHVIAGPIIHWREMIPQFEAITAHFGKRTLTDEYREKMCRGFTLFGIGLAKKLLIADPLAPFVASGYGAGAHIGFTDAWLTSLAYTFQLYFDFSGYTDIAIGVSLLFGVELPFNFNSPYKSQSIQEFWRRWHMTLSRWLRDYVFIPLGGSHGSTVATLRNLFVTFVLGGLWHGASWTFVIWGALHGIAISVHRLSSGAGLRLPGFLATALTFLFVNAAWVFFRAPDAASAVSLLKAMVSPGAGWTPQLAHPPYGLLILAAFVTWGFPASQTIALETRIATRPIGAVLTGAMLAVSILALNTATPSPFLYFNF